MVLKNIFVDGITTDWLHSLAYGDNYFFGDYGIVSVLTDGRFKIINSASSRKKFSLEMLRFIKSIMLSNEYVIIAHNGNGIRGIEKYNFKYNHDLQAYIKGE